MARTKKPKQTQSVRRDDNGRPLSFAEMDGFWKGERDKKKHKQELKPQRDEHVNVRVNSNHGFFGMMAQLRGKQERDRQEHQFKMDLQAQIKIEQEEKQRVSHQLPVSVSPVLPCAGSSSPISPVSGDDSSSSSRSRSGSPFSRSNSDSPLQLQETNKEPVKKDPILDDPFLRAYYTKEELAKIIAEMPRNGCDSDPEDRRNSFNGR